LNNLKIKLTRFFVSLQIAIGTVCSYFLKLDSKYEVKTVGIIPKGFPKPSIPPLWIIQDIIVETITISIISFAMNFAIVDIFSKKYKYKYNSVQELFAYGASNLFGSFFSCFTTGGSLSRSSVQDSAGGKTQIVSIISAILIAIVLILVGPLFQPLPLVLNRIGRSFL
jgi:solute carrier family 26, other